MRTLSIDIETYSSVDLAGCGVYRYVQEEDFEILLFGYAFDDEKVRVIDLNSEEKLPGEVMEALVNPEVLKTAFNANFERTCLSKWLKLDMPPEQWSCTEVMALRLGLPGSLEGVGESLGLEFQKMKSGSRLIRHFCLPQGSRKAKGLKHRNLPQDDMEKWEEFKAYCERDVEGGKVLVIAPPRVARDTWAWEKDKWEHLSYLKISKILGKTSARKAALKERADIYVVNRENVEWLVNYLGEDWCFDMVVIDELSSFKSPSSKRFRALKEVRHLIKRIVGLTGTPAPNGY